MSPKSFQPLKGHRFHQYTDDMLLFVIKDAGEAARNMQGFDAVAEGKYIDQVCDARSVLNYRRRLAEEAAGRVRH